MNQSPPNYAAQQTVGQLFSDIAGLRQAILYLEGRILRKEIAIQEILNGAEVQADVAMPAAAIHAPPPPPAQPAPPAPAAPAPAGSGLTVVAMLKAVLPELNGSTFWYSDLKTKALARFPHDDRKLRRGLYPAVPELIQRGILKRVEGGFKTVVN